MYFSNFNQCSLGKNYFEIREYLGQRVFKLISSEIKRKLMQFFFYSILSISPGTI